MLAAICLLFPTCVSALEAPVCCTLERVNHSDHFPSWSDLGMEHLLAVSGQSNITPPSPVRLASQGRRLSGGSSHFADNSPWTVPQMAFQSREVYCASRSRAVWTRGYLYLIQCLRL